MNRYGSLAQQHWEKYRPNELAGMPDPATFFAELGEQIAYQIAELTRQLEGSSPPGESYVARVGRYASAKSSAEEQVLRETLPQTPDTEPPSTVD